MLDDRTILSLFSTNFNLQLMYMYLTSIIA